MKFIFRFIFILTISILSFSGCSDDSSDPETTEGVVEATWGSAIWGDCTWNP